MVNEVEGMTTVGLISSLGNRTIFFFYSMRYDTNIADRDSIGCWYKKTKTRSCKNTLLHDHEEQSRDRCVMRVFSSR